MKDALKNLLLSTTAQRHVKLRACFWKRCSLDSNKNKIYQITSDAIVSQKYVMLKISSCFETYWLMFLEFICGQINI